MTAIVALAAATVAATAVPPPQPAAAPIGVFPLSGFAAQLDQRPVIAGPAGWRGEPAEERVVAVVPSARQPRRWSLVRRLIGANLGPEATGVLAVMAASEPDLALVPSFRLALAAAAIEAGHPGTTLAGLDDGKLAANPEACAWRLRGFAAAHRFDAAFAQFNCALPALNARKPKDRAAFLYSAAEAALAIGRPAAVSSMLRALPATDLTANLHRGHAAQAIGDAAAAARYFSTIQAGGSQEQRVDVELSLLEARVAARKPLDAAMLRRLDHLAFVWRGDALERRALSLGYRVGVERGDLRRSLAAGATLARRFDLGPDLAPLLAAMRAALAAGLMADSRMPIQQAAGLYWDYRDLAPAGAAGDYLVGQLANRLQEHGLYRRAAELLRHQLTARASDITQGPLSIRVATLFILAGQPGDALGAIKRSEAPIFPPEMLAERHRVESVALYKLGRSAEALAVLQDVPDADLLRAEIFWRRRDWPALASESVARLPAVDTSLGDVEQAILLRYAIALAMLGREPALTELRARYNAAFVGLAGAATFDLLTRAPDTIDIPALSAAMMAIPSASPAGRIGDLFEVAVAPKPATTAFEPYLR